MARPVSVLYCPGVFQFFSPLGEKGKTIEKFRDSWGKSGTVNDGME